MSILVWTTPTRPDTGQNITEGFTHAVPDDLDFLHNSAYQTETFRNLHLRAHPDDTTLAKIMLVSASEIVMNDGFRSSGWTTPLVADLTAVGAGGLDTGAEASSTWYEIHAIAKDDGTKNVMFHVAPALSATATQTTDNTSEKLRQGASDRVKLAQGFQVTTAGQVLYVDLEIASVGSLAASQIWLTIEGDNAGNPNGTPLATSDRVSAPQVATSAQRIRFAFRTPATLATSTQYHLVLQGTYAASTSNYIQWDGNSSNTYASGSAKKFDGTNWAAAVGPADFYFTVFTLINTAAPTMPTGYTRRCKIGYAFNNSGGNIQAFLAKDNLVKIQPGTLAGPVTNTIPALFDIPTAVPHGQVELYLMHAGSVAGDQTTIAGVPDGYAAVPTAQYVHAGTIGSGFSNCPAPLITEAQGFYCYRSSGSGNYTLAIEGFRWS